MTRLEGKIHMLQMCVEIDEKKVMDANQYKVEDIYKAVDQVAADNHLKKVGQGVYTGTGSQSDFAMMGRTILYLGKQEWFMDYVDIWEFDANGSVEDVITFYREKEYEKSWAVPEK